MLKRSKNAVETVAAPSKKERESGIELFRIIAVLIFIAGHYVINSGLLAQDGPVYADPLSWRSIYLLEFYSVVKACVNVFVMITAYFMCTTKITAKKFAKLFLEIFFYKTVISTLFYISGYEPFSIAGYIKNILPLRHLSNDFLCAYPLFFLLIPFLRMLIQHLNEKQHIYLILWCCFTYIFLGSVPGFSVLMNYVSWFSVLFVIISYIRLYPKKIFQNCGFWAWMTVLFVFLSVLSVLVCTWLGVKLNRCSTYLIYFFVRDCNSFLTVVTSLSAFLFFKNLKIGYVKTINTVAASAFGVIVIHANSDIMRRWLWGDMLDAVGHYNTPFLPLYHLGSVAAIFIVCTIIDQLRIKLIEKPFFNLWDRHWDDFLAWYKKLETKVFAKMKVQE